MTIPCDLIGKRIWYRRKGDTPVIEGYVRTVRDRIIEISRMGPGSYNYNAGYGCSWHVVDEIEILDMESVSS